MVYPSYYETLELYSSDMNIYIICMLFSENCIFLIINQTSFLQINALVDNISSDIHETFIFQK